jgi:hypothetical protein
MATYSLVLADAVKMVEAGILQVTDSNDTGDTEVFTGSDDDEIPTFNG